MTDKKEYCDGLDCAWCVTFCCPKEYEYLKARVKELTEKLKITKEALNEIEEYIYIDCEYNDGCDRNICIRCDYSNVHDKRILDIISKAKEIR